MRLDLLLARADLIDMSRPSVTYCGRLGIDFAASVPACGGVFLAPMKSSGQRFEADPSGFIGAWCDVLAEDAETVLDTAAWPIDRPGQVMTLGGMAPALGLSASVNPASYALGGALQLHRTPLGWLQAGCIGASILDKTQGARWLLDLPAPRISVEDRSHARELVASMEGLIDRKRFLVTSPVREAA